MKGEGFRIVNEETDIPNIDNTIEEFSYKVDLRNGLIVGEERWVKGKIGIFLSRKSDRIILCSEKYSGERMSRTDISM